MRSTILSAVLLGLVAFASGCTAMCEDACEEQHDIRACAEGDEDCTMRTAEELLSCVQACNE